jgi:hypothetical protein
LGHPERERSIGSDTAVYAITGATRGSHDTVLCHISHVSNRGGSCDNDRDLHIGAKEGSIV